MNASGWTRSVQYHQVSQAPCSHAVVFQSQSTHWIALPAPQNFLYQNTSWGAGPALAAAPLCPLARACVGGQPCAMVPLALSGPGKQTDKADQGW